jgi:hypothetical protein
MKNIIIIAALLITTSSVFAQTNNTTTADKKATETTKAVEVKEVKQVAAPAVNNATAKYDDDLSQYVGTNDFFLQLVREGVKKG